MPYPQIRSGTSPTESRHGTEASTSWTDLGILTRVDSPEEPTATQTEEDTEDSEGEESGSESDSVWVDAVETVSTQDHHPYLTGATKRPEEWIQVQHSSQANIIYSPFAYQKVHSFADQISYFKPLPKLLPATIIPTIPIEIIKPKVWKDISEDEDEEEIGAETGSEAYETPASELNLPPQFTSIKLPKTFNLAAHGTYPINSRPVSHGTDRRTSDPHATAEARAREEELKRLSGESSTLENFRIRRQQKQPLGYHTHDNFLNTQPKRLKKLWRKSQRRLKQQQRQSLPDSLRVVAFDDTMRFSGDGEDGIRTVPRPSADTAIEIIQASDDPVASTSARGRASQQSLNLSDTRLEIWPNEPPPVSADDLHDKRSASSTFNEPFQRTTYLSESLRGPRMSKSLSVPMAGHSIWSLSTNPRQHDSSSPEALIRSNSDSSGASSHMGWWWPSVLDPLLLVPPTAWFFVGGFILPPLW